MTTKQTFSDWKRQPVTIEVFNGIVSRIEDLKDELSYTAGADPTQDNLKRGAIQALRDVLNMEYVTEEQDE